MKMKLKPIIAAAALLLAIGANAEDDLKNSEFNPITTGVTMLGITPDARGASMGDLGAATDPDVNSQFWNPSKYAFAYSNAGVALSYTPWLRKIVNDIYLANLTGYMKVGSGDNQAVSASLRYFSYGEINETQSGTTINSIHPFEMAFDLGYSRKLSESFAMGVVLRYVYSDMGFNTMSDDGKTSASAFAADVSGYYTTYPVIGRNECQWSIGFNISNIGSKVGYNGGNDPAFLPANLRLGTAFTFPLADYHNLTIGLDANKLLVPAKPRASDYSPEQQNEYEDAVEEWKNKSSISGIFDSFGSDFGKRINLSFGAEYAYNQQFFLRGGYFYESAYNGDRQYFGLGAGFSLNVLRLDAGYMVATKQNSPLDQTLRFTLSFDMDGIKSLFGRN